MRKNMWMEEAIKEMEQEIAAGKCRLKQRQMELAMQLEIKKQGTIFPDETIILLANVIRIVAEANIYGADKVINTKDLLVDKDDLQLWENASF